MAHIESKTTNSKPHTLAVAAMTLGLLLIPFMAMMFSSEVNWSASDFVVMGALVFASGMLVDMAARKAGQYRAIAIFGIILLFLYVWAELAVGIFTNWGS